MNIKSLLIGSAAALAVVSGAQAADAVVAAEPEPMEYVRVCDAYGTGFFYIPGTETCLKISGYVRYEKHWDKEVGERKAYYHAGEARLTFETKNDSEYGTVLGWVRLNSWREQEVLDPVQIRYRLGIGGLEMGYNDNPWTTFAGYGGRTDWGGSYGFQRRQYISYTASMDSFSAFVSLDNDVTGVDADLNGHIDPAGSSYIPDVSAGVSATYGDWSVTAVAGYDESDDSFAIKKKVTGDLGMFGVTLMGFYSNSATNSFWGYDGWSVLLGASAKVTDSVTLAADFQVWDNNDWLAIADVNWAVANGFSVLLEGAVDKAGDKYAMVRFERSF